MRHGSLFSGIGGFDLAAEWMGWNNAFHCEINSFCQQVLKKNFPNSICYGDIKTTDFTIWNGAIDIISGGFPCQPYSVSGNRKGKEDERHLWPEMLRAIREVRPRWFVGENVPGLLNWNDGVVLDEIKADLEAAGFEVFPPTASDSKGESKGCKRHKNKDMIRRVALQKNYDIVGSETVYPHPEFLEEMMGFPTGWTELNH
jgi:site-specific DNA-cytosine methylase